MPSSESLATLRSPFVNPPKISVIIPTHNRPGFLAQAVYSVLNQTIPVYEIIIVDDGSSSSCYPDIFRISSVDSRIKLFQFKKSKGVSVARNFGLTKSTGDFIIFLDDDDLLNPKMFALSHEQFRTNPDADIVYSWSCIYMDHDCPQTFQREQKNLLPNSSDILYIDKYESIPTIGCQPFSAIIQTCVQISSSMIKKESLHNMFFPEELKLGEDAYFWLSLASAGHKFLGINECLSYHRIHPFSSLSRNASKEDINNFYRKLSESGMVNDTLDIILMHFGFFLLFRNVDKVKSLRHAAKCLWHFLRPITIATQSTYIITILIKKLHRRRHRDKLRKAISAMQAKTC